MSRADLQGKKLILGCGQHWPKADDNWRVDIIYGPNVDETMDLNDAEWLFEDNTFLHINASHLVEHLRDLKSFMNECHRILMPGGTLYIETPIAGDDPDLEFADPTHVRCYRPHTFINYMTIEGEGKFKYGFKCWGRLHIETKYSIMRIHLMPIK
jgi:predicted SAM-dependent methyltransferase